MYVDGLERGVVGDGAVAEGKPPGMRGAFTCLFALYDFGGLKKLFYLLFGKRRIVRGRRNERKQEASNNDQKKRGQGHLKFAHGVSPEFGLTLRLMRAGRQHQTPGWGTILPCPRFFFTLP